MTLGRDIWEGEEPLDVIKLTTQCGGDRTFVLEVLEIFREQGERHLADLCKAIEARDIKETGLVAHRISGSAGNMTAMKLSELAAGLELSAVRGSLKGADEAAAEIAREFRHCLAFLPLIRARLK